MSDGRTDIIKTYGGVDNAIETIKYIRVLTTQFDFQRMVNFGQDLRLNENNMSDLRVRFYFISL